MMNKDDVLRTAGELQALGYKKAANIIVRQQEEIENLQQQFDKALDFLSKASNWSKQ
jgi:hypothetical protein